MKNDVTVGERSFLLRAGASSAHYLKLEQLFHIELIVFVHLDVLGDAVCIGTRFLVLHPLLNAG